MRRGSSASRGSTAVGGRGGGSSALARFSAATFYIIHPRADTASPPPRPPPPGLAAAAWSRTGAPSRRAAPPAPRLTGRAQPTGCTDLLRAGSWGVRGRGVRRCQRGGKRCQGRPVEPREHRRRHAPARDPRLGACSLEVLSPSTEHTDRTRKRTVYKEKGVPEYWIVDTDARAIERRRPDDSPVETHTESIEWQPEFGIPALAVDLPVYFDRVHGVA